MKILIPSKPAENSFFQEIILHSEAEFFYGNLNTKIDGFNFVLIQWIEQLFHWKEPTEKQLIELQNTINVWKEKKVKIIHILQNEKRHYGMTNLFEQLFSLVLESVDVFIHFGNFSLHKYETIYNNSKHVLIHHPLYLNTFTEIEKNKARANLEITNNTLVIIIPGTIRNLKERKMVLKYFSSIKRKDKLLITPKMYFRKIAYTQKGYNYLKKVPNLLNSLDVLSNRSLKNKSLMIGEKFLSNEELSQLVCASDIVWSPRLDTLNSGIVYLAYTFKKVVLGPDIGNVGAVLKDMNMPTYNPKQSQTIKIALEQAIRLISEEKEHFNDSDLKKYNPKIIAKQWDNLFSKLND